MNSFIQLPKPQNNGAGGDASQPGTSSEQTEQNGTQAAAVPDDIFSYYEKIDQDDEEETELKTVSFEINQDSLETLQKRYVLFLHNFLQFN